MNKQGLKQLEKRINKITSTAPADMKVEFITCELGSDCPIFKKEGMYAPDNLLVVDGKCQHRLTDENPPMSRFMLNQLEIRDMEGNRVEIV